jgi:outer membrane immunogenic protein
MRRLLVAAGLIASMSDALAGGFELPILRGSDPYLQPPRLVNWSGFYAGGQVGYGVASMDFATSTRDLVAHSLRELALESEQHPSQWQVLGKSNTGSGSVGFFFGYNNRWEDVVLSFEFNYSRVSFASDAPVSPITRLTSAGGNTYLVNITGAASMHITDLATVRARAGASVENFLPYAMIGIAVGRANLSRTATVSGFENPTIPPIPCDAFADPPCTPFSFTESESKAGAFLLGWSLGGGVDIMVMPNVFLRAEYEYVAFAPIWDIKSTISTVRLGAGFKF